MIGIWTDASNAFSGWRNWSSTSYSLAALFAPASQMLQKSAVQLVTMPILILSDFLLHAGRQASTAASATTIDTRSNRNTASPTVVRGIGENRRVFSTYPTGEKWQAGRVGMLRERGSGYRQPRSR